MEVGVHWVQVNLREILGISTLHVIVASIIKQQSHWKSQEEVVTTMEDDRCKSAYDQKKDVDEAA